MATEEEALRSLQNIEKLLKSATALSGNKPNFSGRTQQSQKERADREARKAFKAVASSASDLKDSVLGLSKSLTGLNDEVGSSAKIFGTLNTQMAKFMSSLQPVEVPVAEQPEFVDNKVLVRAIGVWGDLTVRAINNVANILRQQPATPAPTPPAEGFFSKLFNKRPIVVGPQNQPAPQPQQNQAPITPTPRALTDNDVPVRNVLQRMVKNFGMASVTSGGLTFAFEKLIDAAVQATADFFELSRVGMGSVQNLKDLYIYAAQAGMSLAEYNAMLKSSITVASKAGTLENYNRIISSQSDVLAGMGIFGKEAQQFQANLAQSSASAGISIDDLTKATAMQVRTFDKLRKSTNMTAEEFAGMVSSVAKNADAQRELIGLAPQQRLARMQELVQLQTVGTQFGMTAEASKQLGDSLIRMRQATVKERIDQGASLMQLGAFTGNGQMGQRAFELNLKGRRRTSDEDKELLSIVQTLDKSAQGLYENGSLGMQNALDNFDDMLNKGSLGDLIKQGRGATLAKDAGAQNQEAFGKHVGEFGQAVGKLLAWTEGLKNSIAAPIIAAIGAGVMGVFRGPILNTLSKAVSGAGNVGSAVASKLPTMESITGAVGQATTQVFDFFKSIPTFLRQSWNAIQVSNMISGPVKTMQFMFQEFGSSIMSGAKALFEGVSGFASSMAPLAAVTSGIIEAITGELVQAMDPQGGLFARLGGIATAALTALPQMVIDGLKFVFGDSFMKPIQSVFDVIRTGVAGAINGFARILVGSVSFLTDLLPDDSAFKKMVNAAKESLDKSLAANADTINALGGFMGTDRKTLAELSKEHADSAKKATDNTKVVTKAVEDTQSKFNNVMMAGQVTQAGLIADATTLAQPQVQVQPQVQPVTVNKTDAANQPQTPTADNKATPTSDNGEILNVLQALLQVMRDNLDVEKHQASNSDELLARLGRSATSFQSPEEVASKLLKRG